LLVFLSGAGDMSAKQQPAIIRWLPAMVCGAVVAECIYLWLVWQDMRMWFWYDALGLPLVGAILGYSLDRGSCGVYNALRGGLWIRVLTWVVVGGLIGGTMGLLAKNFTSGDFAAILPEDRLMTWLLWAAFGALFALIGVGEDYS
jgi:hypothetical protein